MIIKVCNQSPFILISYPSFLFADTGDNINDEKKKGLPWLKLNGSSGILVHKLRQTDKQTLRDYHIQLGNIDQFKTEHSKEAIKNIEEIEDKKIVER